MITELKRHLKVNEAAILLSLTPARVRELLRGERIQGVRPGGTGSWRIPITSVEQYLSGGYQNAKGDGEQH